MKASIRFPIGD